MPSRVFIEAGVLRIEFSGHVVKADLTTVIAETERLEAGPITPHRITDLSDWQESKNRFPDLLVAVERRKALQFPNLFKSAVVAVQPAQFGVARMFQTLNDHPQITIRIFAELAAAQAWIAEK